MDLVVDLELEIKKTTRRMVVTAFVMGTMLCATIWALVTYQENLMVTVGVALGITLVENRILFSLVRRLNELKAMQDEGGVDPEVQS